MPVCNVTFLLSIIGELEARVTYIYNVWQICHGVDFYLQCLRLEVIGGEDADCLMGGDAVQYWWLQMFLRNI
jgi:hypothetical protein